MGSFEKDYDYELEFYDENKIEELLLFRKVVEIKNYDTLVLDNGVELEIIPNEGCGGCCSGNYWIGELNTCDNVITNIEFEEDEIDFDGTSYKIFVLAENKKIMLANIEGYDGNGYYGTGYTIQVKLNKNKESI